MEVLHGGGGIRLVEGRLAMSDLFDKGPAIPKVPAGGSCTPAPIGSGPEGETCGSCGFYERVGYRAGVHLKCRLMIDEWTHGPGTDIKAGWPACRFWKRGE